MDRPANPTGTCIATWLPFSPASPAVYHFTSVSSSSHHSTLRSLCRKNSPCTFTLSVAVRPILNFRRTVCVLSPRLFSSSYAAFCLVKFNRQCQVALAVNWLPCDFLTLNSRLQKHVISFLEWALNSQQKLFVFEPITKTSPQPTFSLSSSRADWSSARWPLLVST